MGIHDWTRVPAGLFHDFHQSWSIAIKNSLNAGRLPPGLSALVEQKTGPKEGDVIAIESQRPKRHDDPAAGGLLLKERPATRFVRQTDRDFYADRANRIVVRHHLGRVVAVIEIVSPGNKAGELAFHDFIDKVARFIARGIHVLVVDLFPPTTRDPSGIHKAVWDQFLEEDFLLPEGKDRVLVSYEAGAPKTAFIETVGVGDPLPDMPLFVAEGVHVAVPLDATYQLTWELTPEIMRGAVETGVLPESEADGE